MKKSEIVKMVELIVKQHVNMNVQEKPRPTHEQCATAIVNTLVDMGMAAPKYEPFPGAEHLFETRDWEPEDA